MKKFSILLAVAFATILALSNVFAGCDNLPFIGPLQQEVATANQRIAELEGEGSTASGRIEAQASRIAQLESELESSNERAEVQASRANDLEEENRTQTRTIRRLEHVVEEAEADIDRIAEVFRPELNEVLPALPDQLGNWSNFTAHMTTEVGNAVTGSYTYGDRYLYSAGRVIKSADRGTSAQNRLRSVLIQITRTPALREIAWVALRPSVHEMILDRPIEEKVTLRGHLVHLRDIYLADTSRFTADQQFLADLEEQSCDAYEHINGIDCREYKFIDFSPIDAEMDSGRRGYEAFTFRRMREGVDPASLIWVINQIIGEIDASAS